MTIIGLDFESLGYLNLKKVGSSRYWRDKRTKPLLLGWAIDDNPADVVRLAEGEDLPNELVDALEDPHVLKYAWNASFEIQGFEHGMKMPIPIKQWRCSMVQSFSLSFPGSLDTAGRLLGIDEDKQKLARGKALIKRFCMPRKPTKKEPWELCTHLTNPEEWEEFVEYCRTDVEAERALRKKMSRWELPIEFWREWWLDQRINRAGIPVNLKVVKNAIKVAKDVVDFRLAKMRDITGVKNPNSAKQILPWLKEQGYIYDDLKKINVNKAYKAAEEGSPLQAVLGMRLEVSKTSVKKYNALDNAADEDGVIRNCHQFFGAPRTNRDGGRIYQPQNLAKPPKYLEGCEEEMVRHLEVMDSQQIEMLYEKPMDLLSACTRPVVQPPKGFKFADADLSAIENRVIGWLARDEKILDVFRNNRDPYLDFATYMYGEPYDKLYAEYKAGNKTKRNDCKPATLGCFSAETLVLTKRGYIPIVQVSERDWVFDGVEFVPCDGSVYQGQREVIELHGVLVTPDHKILVGDAWKEAGHLIADSNLSRLALSTANGLLSANLSANTVSVTIHADVTAVKNTTFIPATCDSEKAASAIHVPANHTAEPSACGSEQTYTTSLPTGITPCAEDARTLRTRSIITTGAEGYDASSQLLMPSLNTVLMCSEPTAPEKSTAKTTTATTSPETSDSQRDSSKLKIHGLITRSSTRESDTLVRGSIERSPPHMQTHPRSCESSAKDCLLKKSSPIRFTSALDVYDVANAGPRNRFVIMTDAGPMIAHNCGFMLSAGVEKLNKKTGEMEANGLLGYAKGMGVNLTPETATKAVKVFRGTFLGVVDFWYDLDRAMRKTIITGEKTRVGFIAFDKSGPFVRMHLPSGRCLHYFRPRIRDHRTPWGAIKPTIMYEGLNDKKKWGIITTHPGKITENAVQAVARDILFHGAMLAYRKRRLDIRLRIHDQLVAVVPEDRADEELNLLIEDMTTVPDWAPGLILGAAGTVASVFAKD